MPCEHFAWFINNPDYRFATVDIVNDLKALQTSGLDCQRLVDIHGHYKCTTKEKESLVDLAAAIIDPYYSNMKDECKKDKTS